MAAQQIYVDQVGPQWVGKFNGREVTQRYGTQAEAIRAAGIWLAANGGGERMVRNLQGQWRAKDTIHPGQDPRTIPG